MGGGDLAYGLFASLAWVLADVGAGAGGASEVAGARCRSASAIECRSGIAMRWAFALSGVVSWKWSSAGKV